MDGRSGNGQPHTQGAETAHQDSRAPRSDAERHVDCRMRMDPPFRDPTAHDGNGSAAAYIAGEIYLGENLAQLYAGIIYVGIIYVRIGSAGERPAAGA